MKGLEKLNYPRLAKLLSQDGRIPPEVLSEALRHSNESGISFPEILVRDGLISEWELARLISQEFSLPAIFPSTYSIDKETWNRIPAEMIQRTRVIPLDVFGGVMSVAMSLLVPYSVLEEIAAKTKLEVFPFVAPVSEIQKILDNKFPAPKAKASAFGEDWEKLFDEADAKVKKVPEGDSSPG